MAAHKMPRSVLLLSCDHKAKVTGFSYGAIHQDTRIVLQNRVCVAKIAWHVIFICPLS